MYLLTTIYNMTSKSMSIISFMCFIFTTTLTSSTTTSTTIIKQQHYQVIINFFDLSRKKIFKMFFFQWFVLWFHHFMLSRKELCTWTNREYCSPEEQLIFFVLLWLLWFWTWIYTKSRQLSMLTTIMYCHSLATDYLLQK